MPLFGNQQNQSAQIWEPKAADGRLAQTAGASPTGVIPPYSMPAAAVTASTGAKDAFRASRCLRTRLFTSARVVAATTQAA